MEPNRQESTSWHARFFTVLVIIVTAFLLISCSSEKKSAISPPPTVTVIETVKKDVPVVAEYVAQTQSSHLVSIHARVNGFLDKCLYKEGSVVRQGQVLFQMDPKPFQVQYNQNKAALETARLNLARVKPLTEQKALAQKDLDEATGQYHSAAAAVEQAKAQVEAAKLNLSYTTITSPVTGISSSARQTEGTYINLQNSLLTTVAVVSPIWVNFSISENEMQRNRDQIAKGLLRFPGNERFTVEVVLVDGSVHPYAGQITFAEPSYNAQTGTFLIRASIDNPNGMLRPNQYVRTRLKGAIRPNAILVPQRSVQQGPKGHFVWIVNRKNKTEQRPVVVGEWHGNDWFIFEGLRSGEKVVVDGGLTLQPGMSVITKQYKSGQEMNVDSADISAKSGAAKGSK